MKTPEHSDPRSHSRRHFRDPLAITVGLALTFVAATASANTGFMLETIDDFSYALGTHAYDLNCNTQGSGLWNALTASGTPWTGTFWWQDNNVYDTDFYDPDLTGWSSDNDTYNFDRDQTGFSYSCGHGTCDDATNSACTSDGDCGTDSYCPDFPLSPGQTAACINISERRMITSSTYSSHGNVVWYGDNPGGSQPTSIALGEDSSSGSWAGVGTNGGTNVAVISNSCGIRFRVRTQDQNYFFAGVHFVMMHMPVGNIYTSSGADVADALAWSGRGATLANLILTNVNAPVYSAWLAPSMTNNNYYGAGADIVAAWDTSATAVINRMSYETWAQSTDESRDVTAATEATYWYNCNFSNCSSYAL